jgi:hypothetical protein
VIAWLNPAALAGLSVLAIPILIHLLRQHRASRVVFPSLRFVHSSRTAAVRLRSIADPWLLLLRLAALALAVFALAEPMVVTPSRLSAWNARVARAVVVDTSESMRLLGAESAAREAAGAEMQSAFSARRFESADLDAALEQAAAWLATAPPARRELVLVSDFQRTLLAQVNALHIRDTVGRRAVQVGVTPAERRFQGEPRIAGRTDIQIDQATTRVTLTTTPPAKTGLRLVTDTKGAGSAQGLLRAVAAAGSPAPSADEPVAVVFTGAQGPASVEPIGAGWMLDTVLRLMEDSELHDASTSAAGPEHSDGPGPWTTVARDAQNRTVVRAAAAGSELVIDVAAPPDSYLAAAAVRGVLLARPASMDYDEQEIVRASSAELSAWSRETSPVGREVAVFADRTDARWFWMLSLLILGIEALVRRPPRSAAQEAHADAA